MLGLPAEDVPDAPADEPSDRDDDPSESADGEETEETGRGAHSTQFGVPAPDGDSQSDGGPEIDPSASGPDESARDWSDLDPGEIDEEDDESGGREERSTHFGLPSADDTGASGPGVGASAEGSDDDARGRRGVDPGRDERDGGDEPTDADEEGREARSTHFGLPSLERDSAPPEKPDRQEGGVPEAEGDWSDLDEAAADEPEEGSILSAWGVDEGSSPTRRSDARLEDAESKRRAASGEQESGSRDSHETHMGMPRFDPDRVDEEEDEGGEGELGDESTVPGGPNESVEAESAAESGGASGEMDADSLDEFAESDDVTRQIDIDSLKQQVAELEDEGEAAAAAERPGAAGSERDARDTSPGSQVVRGSEQAPEEPAGEDDEVDPSSTFHGKAGKAIGGGFREPGQPDRASDVVEDSGGTTAPGTANDKDKGREDDGDDRDGRQRRETVGGLPGDDALVPGGEEPEEEGAEADDSHESTRIGKSIAAGSEQRDREDSRPEGGEARETDGNDGGFPLPSPGQLNDVNDASDEGPAVGGDTSSDRGQTGPRGEESPRAPEADEKTGEAEPETAPDGEDAAAGEPAPSPAAEVPADSAEEPAGIEEGTVPKPDSESGGAGAKLELDLGQESSPDHFFEEIEEDVADELEEQELEEVDFGAESEPVDDVFAFEEEVSFEAEESANEPEAPSEAPESSAAVEEVPPPTAASDQLESEEAGTLAEQEESAASVRDDAEGDAEVRPVSEFSEASSGTGVQSVIGVVAGVTLISFLGLQTVLGGQNVLGVETAGLGLVEHYLVLSLILASGLGAAASFVTPSFGSDTRTKRMIYMGFGMLIGALAVAVIVMVTKGLAVGPLLALSGAVLAFGAGLVPATQ